MNDSVFRSMELAVKFQRAMPPWELPPFMVATGFDEEPLQLLLPVITGPTDSLLNAIGTNPTDLLSQRES